MLRIPKTELSLWARELVDECMASAGERAMVYTRAAQYYYCGSYDSRAALHNKIKPFIDRLGGFLMQASDVRFQLVFDSSEPEDVLKRAELTSEKLTADFRETDSDISFADAVIWALVNGSQILKIRPDGQGFRYAQVHPQNFGVLSETIQSIDEQEAICHVTFPTISRISSWLDDIDHPRKRDIMRQIFESRQTDKDSEQPEYFHQLVVGGLQPLGNMDSDPPSAAGIVNVFPVPTPWRPQRRVSRTVRHCELWIKDRDRDGDWTTLQLIYPDIIIEGDNTRRNISRIPGKTPFVKVQPSCTPGYFWGRSRIADVQMLQDVVNKRLRDLKIIWDRNAAAPMAFSGFTGITEEIYYKLMSEGGFVNDSNPNAKAEPLVQPPPPNYLDELEFIWQMFDEASGFTPIMSGQGEPGVRAGTHAQTLVRTSSPPLITQAAAIERQLADAGYLAVKVMQAVDPSVYITDSGTQFLLAQLPENFQVQVDSHSASPAFAEDNMQKAAALFKAGAIDAEDLLHLAHLPGTDLFLARLKERQKKMAQAAQQQEQAEVVKGLLGIPGGKAAGGQKKR